MASLPPLALKTRDKPLHRQLSMAPSRMDIVPEKIVMFTDAGTDLDDEMAMIFARYLIEFNFIDLLGVVSVLHPSFKRAQLRGHHGHDRPPAPVASGTDGGDVAGRNEAPDAASFSYMPPDGSERSFSLETGRTLLYRILVAAEPKSVGVVKEVSIMGGVTAASVDRGGLLEPDTAHNNVFDATAAAFFYRRCQELGVRLVIVGRDAAYQVPITRRVYEGLAHTGSPIGWRLRNAQRTRRAASEGDARAGLPARCDAAWFKATFCGGDGGVDDRGAGDPIWDLVKSFNMYDTLALIAAVPLLRDLLFDPVAVDVPATRGGGTGASHLLIGVSKENDGFASPEAKAECASLLRAAYATGLVLDHHAKSQIVVTMQVQPNKADEFMGLALLRALIELQAVDLLGIVLTSEERFGEVTTLEAAAARTRATLNALGLHNTRVLVQHASKRACQLEELYARRRARARALDRRSAGRTSKRSRARSSRLVLDGSRALVDCSNHGESARVETVARSEVRLKIRVRAGVRLVVIHSQTDAADFASRSPELFREKTLGAVVMGGVVATGLGVEDDGVVPCAALVPDADASNNRADEVAATFFTARCQALGVPMTVISRHLALACRLPRSVYDALGARGGPVGASVCDAQRASIEHLWRQVHLPAGHRDRQRKLADRCDATWFRDTFCGDDDALVDPPPSPSSPSTPRTPRRSRDAPPLPPASEDVWPYVSSFNVYTPLALLAALRLFLCRLIFKGVLMNASHFPDDPPSFAIDGVGTVDLDDAVPDCVDLHHERLVAKQETISKTILARILALKSPK
ncbi:hypothetical protein JL720_4737 [Aureococcus anophagefferens]|nr:hypothetical protein JL720_4737 [Aureococcus anophagefferens]